MIESNTKSSFDRLVAGLNAEDRLAMLNRINQVSPQGIQLEESLLESETPQSLKKKLESESIFYKFFLWIRALFDKKNIEEIYGQDIINSIAKKINHRYP